MTQSYRTLLTEDIVEITEKMLGPIMDHLGLYKNPKTFMSFLSLFFNEHIRDVYFGKCQYKFTLPSKAWVEAPGRLIYVPPEERKVAVGTPLVVRVDHNPKNPFTEIEHNDRVFVLTNAQWKVIRTKITRVA